MALSYPLSFPATQAPRRIAFRARSVVGLQPSPLSLEQTVYAWTGDCWEADIEAPPMKVADAEEWVSGLLLALNGMEGTFLMGPGDAGYYTGVRGTWTGQSPLFSGAHAAGLRTISVKSAGASKTWKLGDWMQFGSGSASRLHKVVKDGTSDGSGNGTIEIWPRTRAAYANGASITIASPKGMWRLASNTREWSVDLAQIFGLAFACVEARDS